MKRVKKDIKYHKIRKARLSGSNKTDALRAGGVKETSIRGNVNRNATLKYADAVIEKELKESDLTVELLINRVNEDRVLAKLKGDISTMRSCDELLFRFKGMLRDNIKIEQVDSASLYDQIRSNYKSTN